MCPTHTDTGGQVPSSYRNENGIEQNSEASISLKKKGENSMSVPGMPRRSEKITERDGNCPTLRFKEGGTSIDQKNGGDKDTCSPKVLHQPSVRGEEERGPQPCHRKEGVNLLSFGKIPLSNTWRTLKRREKVYYLSKGIPARQSARCTHDRLYLRSRKEKKEFHAKSIFVPERPPPCAIQERDSGAPRGSEVNTQSENGIKKREGFSILCRGEDRRRVNQEGARIVHSLNRRMQLPKRGKRG